MRIRTEGQVLGRLLAGQGRKAGTFGRHWSYNLHDDPKRLAFVLARYRFAAKLVCSRRKILELGCSEGIGAPVLGEFASKYTGVDMDQPAISTARRNFPESKYQFVASDFLGKKYGSFDTVISMDVIEHIERKFERLFLDTVRKNLGTDGICMIGTPNIAADRYASPTSKMGHVNLYDAARLEKALRSLFHNVFIYSMNDEVVHTGFSPMAHYLIAMGCYLKSERVPR